MKLVLQNGSKQECANTGTLIRQRTGAELSRRAPRLHTMIYSLGLQQKQDISHRVERSSHYSRL